MFHPSIHRSPVFHLAFAFAVCATLVWSLPAAAGDRPSSDLLLPFFEVDLDSATGSTTLVAVGSSAEEPVDVRIEVTSNWGIPVVRSTVTLMPGEVRTFNLRDWLVAGSLPDRTMGAPEQRHVQSCLAGEPSPRDGLYYASKTDPLRPGLMVGAVTFRVVSQPRQSVLWGDYFWVRPGEDFAAGDLLVDIDRSTDCPDICDLHRLRFLQGGGFDGGTRLVVWSDRRGVPSATADPLSARALISAAVFHDEPGVRFDERHMDLLPVGEVAITDLALAESFGWLEMLTDEPVFVGVRYSADDRYSIGLASWCLEDDDPPVVVDPPEDEPSIRLEKATNGQDADVAPGPSLEPGTEIRWTYDVTNNGDTVLTQIVVTDDQGVAVTCPATTLAVGATMTCDGSGTAASGPYRNVGTVTARSPDGEQVSDSDPSHYTGDEAPITFTIGLEKATNGHDADVAPGPELAVGETVSWTYVVTNGSPAPLTDVTVTDSRGVAVTCPSSVLAAESSMTCQGNGTATAGQYHNVGTVTARTPGGAEITASDPSHYVGVNPPSVGISIEKATNGQDADLAPGSELVAGDAVTWTYVVTNTGQTPLADVVVSDDRGVAVSCPSTELAAGADMTCNGGGTATVGQYRNVGTVTAEAPSGQTVSDSDPSHYKGVDPPPPAVSIEKATNGQDADHAPGPSVYVGEAVSWAYVVTNTGETPLSNVSVSDDQGVAVSCPSSQLAVGASMTCTGSGVAVYGQYRNVGTVTGRSPRGEVVSDADPSHYKGKHRPASIHIEKATNGHDADAAPGPEIAVGDGVTWTYVVTNTGQAPLADVSVSDDQGVSVSCPSNQLAVGQSMTCEGFDFATKGQYRNVGTVTGRAPSGQTVSDTDPSHYKGKESCGDCEGKVTRLTIQYKGHRKAWVKVTARHGSQWIVVFEQKVHPGGTFELVGPSTGNGGFSGTLGTEIRFYVDWDYDAKMHTSCSKAIGPGTREGDFLVLAGQSRHGGDLCPVSGHH